MESMQSSQKGQQPMQPEARRPQAQRVKAARKGLEGRAPAGLRPAAPAGAGSGWWRSADTPLGPPDTGGEPLLPHLYPHNQPSSF